MAFHYRKTIRDKIGSMLTGNVLYNSVPVIIYPSRVVPYWEIELPAIAYYVLTEAADDEETSQGARIYSRVLNMAVQVIVEEKTGVIPEDIIDEIVYQIEDIFFKNPEFDKVIYDSKLVNTEIVLNKEAKRLFASCLLTFAIEYETEVGIDPATLDDFVTEKTGIDINNDGAADITSDSKVQAP